MAHCIWLGDEEIYTLRERGVGIAHCPNSNISIRSGLCDVRRLLNHGLKVGLGTGEFRDFRMVIAMLLLTLAAVSL